jgi:Lycopene cyclase protein
MVQVVDEEFSFIPVGGPMPRRDQPLTAFGAAANLVHPATGYSITRMLEESGPLADAMVGVLRQGLPVAESSAEVWDALWPMEKRRQVRAQ